MVVGKDSLDMAGPARRLAALAQAHAEVAPQVERPDRDMDRAPERDKARLRAGQADTPVHTPGVAGRLDKATAAWRHLALLRYMADTGRTMSGWREAVLMPEQPVVTTALIVSTAVEERPVPLAV